MSPALGRLLRPAALALSCLVLVTGCGSSEETSASGGSASSSPAASASGSPSASASESPAASPSPSAGTVVDITIADGEATPQGKALQVAIGEPVTLRVQSDVAGELHVHSTPEQEIAFGAGTTEEELVLDRPGVVDVEDHGLGQLLVRLEVR